MTKIQTVYILQLHIPYSFAILSKNMRKTFSSEQLNEHVMFIYEEIMLYVHISIVISCLISYQILCSSVRIHKFRKLMKRFSMNCL